MLDSVFGVSSAAVVQFFVILVFVLILTGVCYWLFRRYFSNGLASGGRGRGPRLGVVDSISIDQRHRLVLVRRDNVEHLLLIGKSADLVVEPSIVRAAPAGARPRQVQEPRQQAQRPQQRPAAPPASPQQQPTARPAPPQQPRAAAPAPPRPVAAPAAPPPTAPPTAPQASAVHAAPTVRPAPASAAPQRQATGISEPIPFPQNRRPQNRPAQFAEAEPTPGPDHGDRVASETAQRQGGGVRAIPAIAPTPVATSGGVSATSASAHFEEPAHPTRVEPAFSPADATRNIADESILAKDPQATPDPEPSRTASRRPELVTEVPSAAEAPRGETSGVPSDERAAVEDEPVPVAAGGDGPPPSQAPAETTADNDEDRAATVSNLEQEMARLLGEITSKRDG